MVSSVSMVDILPGVANAYISYRNCNGFIRNIYNCCFGKNIKGLRTQKAAAKEDLSAKLDFDVI